MRFDHYKDIRRYSRMRKRADNERRLEKRLNGNKRIHQVGSKPHESNALLMSKFNKGVYNEED